MLQDVFSSKSRVIQDENELEKVFNKPDFYVSEYSEEEMSLINSYIKDGRRSMGKVFDQVAALVGQHNDAFNDCSRSGYD